MRKNVGVEDADFRGEWVWDNAIQPDTSIHVNSGKIRTANPAFGNAAGVDLYLYQDGIPQNNKLMLKPIQQQQQHANWGEQKGAMISANRVTWVQGGWANFGDASIMWALNFDLNVVIGGYLFTIPDLWWIHNTIDPTNTNRVISNWCDYQAMYLTKKDDSIEVYAYANNEPWNLCALSLRVTDKGATHFEVARWLTSGAAGDFVDEFNYSLAVKRRDSGWNSVDPHQLYSGTVRGSGSAYVVMRHPANKWTSSNIVIDQDSVRRTTRRDYASLHTLRNNTAAALTMKTSDYARKITDTTQTAHTWTNTGTFEFNYKAAVNVGIEGAGLKGEWSIKLVYTHTDTVVETTTHADETTFTVSGQTVAVPPFRQLLVTQDWWRANLAGKAIVMVDMKDGDTKMDIYDVRPGSAGSSLTFHSVLDIINAQKLLGLKAYTYLKETNQWFVKSILYWEADIGVMGDISMEETALSEIYSIQPVFVENPDAPKPKPDPAPSELKATTTDTTVGLSWTGGSNIKSLFIDGTQYTGSMSVVAEGDSRVIQPIEVGSGAHTAKVNFADGDSKSVSFRCGAEPTPDPTPTPKPKPIDPDGTYPVGTDVIIDQLNNKGDGKTVTFRLTTSLTKLTVDGPFVNNKKYTDTTSTNLTSTIITGSINSLTAGQTYDVYWLYQDARDGKTYRTQDKQVTTRKVIV